MDELRELFYVKGAETQPTHHLSLLMIHYSKVKVRDRKHISGHQGLEVQIGTDCKRNTKELSGYIMSGT